MTLFLLDVNVVLAGHRADHPQHNRVRPWLADLTHSADQFTIPATVSASFLRLATHRRVFPVPTPRQEAFDYLDALQMQPRHILLGPGLRHLVILRRVCEEAEATADLIPDAVLAAIAVEHAATIATMDRDFARFANISVVQPGAL